MRTYFLTRKMKENKQFRIDIYGLKNGVHEFDFEFNDTLFDRFENRLIESGSGDCQVILTKKERMIELSFLINGSIELICDRSLEAFDYPLNLEHKLILKYGEEFDDSNDEMWVIPSGQQSINIAQLLYEYMSLAVPMKKLHPRFEEDEDEAELAFVYSSDDIDEQDPEDESENNDPRWAALKNIKNLN